MFVACQTKQEAANETTRKMPYKPEHQNGFRIGKYQSHRENNESAYESIERKDSTMGIPNIDKLRQNRIDELEARNTALRAKINERREYTNDAGTI